MRETMRTSRQIYAGRVVTLRVDEVCLANGRTSQREVVSHPGAVAVVACPDNEHIVLVKQYRYAAGETMWELPAGLIEQDEEPQNTAIRELEEETGFRTGRMTHLLSFYSSPGFCDEMIHVYHATALSRTGQKNFDVDECLCAHTFSLSDVKEMMRRGDIVDAKTVAGILAYMASLPGRSPHSPGEDT